jgi:hypothetical protein
MDQNPKLPNGLSMQEVMRLAASPAGQQLIALMQNKGGEEFNRAMQQAAAGNYSGAKQAMESLLKDPQAQRLLKDLGR